MSDNPKFELILTPDRKLVGIKTDGLEVRLNGLANADYQGMLKFAGIKLTFASEETTKLADAASKEEKGN